MSSRVGERDRRRERGRGLGRTVARGSVMIGLLCALVLAGAGYVAWELRALAAHRADGDPAQGYYQQDPERADRTASAVRDGILREDPEPPTDAAAFAEPGGGRRSGGWQPSEPLEARPAPAEPTAGALFSPGNDGDPDHHCSGVVVHSPGGDLVATAAHCVYGGGFRTNLAFVPGYRDGVAPFGVWVPTRIDVDPAWAEDQDPDADVAFVRVRRPGFPGQRLEDVTGARTLAFGAALPAPARLMGYPNVSEQPLDCRTTARPAGPTQLRLDCAHVPNGTSGGPVLTERNALIGVIGGRDGGGDDETSYSVYFGDRMRALYERSTQH
ncbi:serine protease [Streptomyces sp. NPDC047014]|uniref:trypsin-like serine peptidase n=1 Tax=Streptomyces sp. NPDC047014 TaxID=3155736 RepID=UPI0033D04D15